jgi:aspartate/methionine/tyrosine aminotransferase
VTLCHETLEWEQVRARYEADRDVAFAAFAQAGIAPPERPRATPFLFVPADAAALEAAGIPSVDGRAFGAPGHARVAFGGASRLAGELRAALAPVAV